MKFFNALNLYTKYIKINFKANFQYKGWPLRLLQVIIVVITDPLGLIFMFSRFGSVGEWTVERIIMIYALAVTGFGLAECFCRGFDVFPWRMVRNGELDRVMLRPRTLFTQIIGSYFHIHRLSRVAGGIFAVCWCIVKQNIELGALDVLMLVLALLGGFLTYSGVFVFSSGLSFFTVQGTDWIYIFTNASYQVTQIPMNHMPRILRNVFTFFMPMFVISYYPASAVCGWGEAYWKGLLAFPAGFVFLMVSILVWRFGVSKYKSTGS